jgi:hypothetical protein
MPIPGCFRMLPFPEPVVGNRLRAVLFHHGFSEIRRQLQEHFTNYIEKDGYSSYKPIFE